MPDPIFFSERLETAKIMFTLTPDFVRQAFIFDIDLYLNTDPR
jgi:hypothetical protein